ncbi:MAG: hypothetical protein A3E57_01310 [Candidatus Muproteobacteria bacterium RIFCSPHIGHO2_12_FULL_60_33]|nr:MAG: hypothetical protein A3E57_01310 [Candidatus Muproteobacteria bacterium RIFCSPHIGHO2_12_FULL_60_33]
MPDYRLAQLTQIRREREAVPEKWYREVPLMEPRTPCAVYGAKDARWSQQRHMDVPIAELRMQKDKPQE